MDKILVAGGTGLIGKHLCKKLKAIGYDVSILSRSRKLINSSSIFYWNPDNNEIEIESLNNIDYIINLAGANISSQRWTKKRKIQIIDSRVNSGLVILNAIKKHEIKIKAYISASAIGYYGTITTQNIFIESDAPSVDFLSEVCQKWELTTDKFNELGIRTVKIRTGIVLALDGGALNKMTTPIKQNIGSILGSGNQYMPWIHLEDLCNIYVLALTDKQFSGAINAVAPMHISHKDFTLTIASILNKKIFLPNTPAFLIKLIFGNRSNLILNGSRISSNKIIELGYTFKFPKLEGALKNIFQKALN